MSDENSKAIWVSKQSMDVDYKMMQKHQMKKMTEQGEEKEVL